jgi:hypothetical protein
MLAKLALLLSVPVGSFFGYQLFHSLANGRVTEAMGYGFPIMILICVAFAAWEHRQAAQRQNLQEYNRLERLSQFADTIASQIRRQAPPHEIRSLINQQALRRNEKLLVLYLGWRNATGNPVSRTDLKAWMTSLETKPHPYA